MTELQSESKPGTESARSLDVDVAIAREMGEKFLDLVLGFISQVRDLPVFPPSPAADLASRLSTDLPNSPVSATELFAECDAIIENCRQNGHPRFYGYVASPATIPGIFADFLASALNQNVTSWRSTPSAATIERIVLKWIGELTGFGSNAAGVLTSGGSMANLEAVLIAHRSRCKHDAGRAGLQGSDRLMTLFTTDQTHHSIFKAADITGIGRSQVRIVKTDSNFKMDLRDLREQIVSDLQNGSQPFCVVANAGAVSTGIVDPLAAIAAICREFDLWFHVDGAYGGPAYLDKTRRHLFEGVELADSMSIDAHKWLYSPVDCGCLLFREPAAAFRAFSESSEADYIQVYEREGDEAFAFWDYGIELSRRFRALKLWMMLKYFGVERISAAIAGDIRMADYMARRIETFTDFELMSRPELGICCFRYLPADLGDALRADPSDQFANRMVDGINSALMFRIQRGGEAYLSNASLGGRFALRACIVNFRTTEADIDYTLELVRRVGAELVADPQFTAQS